MQQDDAGARVRAAAGEIEATILRLRDAVHRFEGIGPGEPARRLLPPYEVSFSAEPTILRICSCMTDESIHAANADMKDAWPGNEAVASSARVVDAKGRTLQSMGGAGSGGLASIMYGADPYASPQGIAYPVTVTVPDPTPEERIRAVFRFEGLALPPVRDRWAAASPWGEPVAGLSIRADVPARVEEGERLPTTVEVVVEAKGLPEGVTRLENRLPGAFLTLRLTPAGGGETVVVRPDDETLGMPFSFDDLEPPPPLRQGDGPPLRTVFPLARHREEPPPGRYDGLVEYAYPGPEDRWPAPRDERDRPGFWRGTLRSGTFSLEIVPEPARTRAFRLPARLRLASGLRLIFLPEDAKAVDLPVRNGFFLGTTVEFADPDRGRSERSGVPAPDDPDPLLTLPPDHRGPFFAKATITVFRTLDPPSHAWPHQAGYEVLWSRTFDVSYTAEEVDALR